MQLQDFLALLGGRCVVFLQAFFLQQLFALEWVFEAIPQLELCQTANPAAEVGHDQWTHHAGADAEPIPDLDFDQTSGW